MTIDFKKIRSINPDAVFILSKQKNKDLYSQYHHKYSTLSNCFTPFDRLRQSSSYLNPFPARRHAHRRCSTLTRQRRRMRRIGGTIQDRRCIRHFRRRVVRTLSGGRLLAGIMIENMQIILSPVHREEFALNAGKHQIRCLVRMLALNVTLNIERESESHQIHRSNVDGLKITHRIGSTLNAAISTERTLVRQRLFTAAVRPPMTPKRVVVIRLVRTVRTAMHFRLGRRMVQHVRSLRRQRRANRRTNVAPELDAALVQRSLMIAQMPLIVEAPIAVPTSVHRAGHRVQMCASVVLQLLGVLERLVALVTLEVALVRVNAHMRVRQARSDRRLEVALFAAVQLHVDLVLTPQVRVQGVPRAIRCGRVRTVRTGQATVGGVTAFVIGDQCGGAELHDAVRVRAAVTNGLAGDRVCGFDCS